MFLELEHLNALKTVIEAEKRSAEIDPPREQITTLHSLEEMRDRLQEAFGGSNFDQVDLVPVIAA